MFMAGTKKACLKGKRQKRCANPQNMLRIICTSVEQTSVCHGKVWVNGRKSNAQNKTYFDMITSLLFIGSITLVIGIDCMINLVFFNL